MGFDLSGDKTVAIEVIESVEKDALLMRFSSLANFRPISLALEESWCLVTNNHIEVFICLGGSSTNHRSLRQFSNLHEKFTCDGNYSML